MTLAPFVPQQMFAYTQELTVDVWGDTPAEAEARANNLPELAERYRPISKEADDWLVRMQKRFSIEDRKGAVVTLRVTLTVYLTASSRREADDRVQALVGDFAWYLKYLHNVSRVSTA